MKITMDTEICSHCLYQKQKLSLVVNAWDDQLTMECTVCGNLCTDTTINQEIKMHKIEIQNSEREIRELLTIFRNQ